MKKVLQYHRLTVPAALPSPSIIRVWQNYNEKYQQTSHGISKQGFQLKIPLGGGTVKRMFRPWTPRDVDRLSPRRGSQETRGGGEADVKAERAVAHTTHRASGMGARNSTRTRPPRRGPAADIPVGLQETISRLGEGGSEEAAGARARRDGGGGGGNGGCGPEGRMRGRDGPARDVRRPGRRAGPGREAGLGAVTRRERAAARGPGRARRGGGRRAAGHLPHSRNSATYLSRRRAEWLHSVYRQTSIEQRLHAQALSLRQGPSRSSCSSFLSRTLADMPRGPLPTRRPLPARSAGPSGAPAGPGGREPQQRRLAAAPSASSRPGLGRPPGLGPGRRSVWGAGPRGSMGRSPPSAPPPAPPGAAGPAPAARPRGPHPRPRPPRRPPPQLAVGLEQRGGQHRCAKPGRRPSPRPRPRPGGPAPRPAANQGAASAGAANHGGAGRRRRADLSAPPRPAPRAPTPGAAGPRRLP